MWYDISAELGVTLTPATAYSYQFFVMEKQAEHPVRCGMFTTQQGSARGGFCAYRRRTDQ